ncbi:MAG: PD-(D/E)XK nuclease family protein [Caldilineaceae bacterium]|nr:PD-(D/E)XK nuclease family protein [Caldilineaceae bacterium]
MQTSSVFVEPIQQAQERLEDLLRQYQAKDPFAPVTVIVPTPFAGLHLRRDIGRRGLVNVRFMVLARLAELLGAPRLAAQEKRPLKPLIRFAEVRRAARGAGGQLEPFRAHPSFHASLHRTFRELRNVEKNRLAALKQRGGITGETVRLFERFRAATESYYDPETLAHEAADVVKGQQTTALDALGQLIAYLPHDLKPGEQRLLEALHGAGNCATVLGITGEGKIDRELLAGAPGAEDLSSPPDAATRGPHASGLLVTSDIREEVRSVAREIAAAAHAGTPFQRMAVLYWQQEPYAPLVAEQFAIAGIPTAGPPAGRLAATAAGRTVKGIVDLAGGDLPREEIMRWLTSCPAKAGRTGHSPARWDAVSRDAGVIAGIEQWRDRLARYAAAQEQAGEERNEEPSEAERTLVAESISEARALRGFILRLHDDLAQAGSCRTWPQLVAWAENLVEHYLDKASLPLDEQENLEKLEGALQELAALSGDEDLTLEDFRAALDESLKRSAAISGALGEGVFVGPVGSAVGMRFDRAYLLGMVEGLVPSRPSEDPLLPEQDRELAGLPPRLGAAAERYDYLAAASTAHATVLTFPRSNNIAQRVQRPSQWLLEEASLLYGSRVYPSMLTSPDDLASLRAQPWFTEVPSAQAGISALSASQPADVHDYDLHRLWHWRDVGRRIGRHHLAAPETVLARALAMHRARRSAGLTVWDGDLSHARAASGRIGLSSSEVFSPTRLETWARCPFNYFLANVLGIAAPQQPEEITTISARERGSLVHTTLERFIRAVQAQDAVPAPDQPWSDEQRHLLGEIATEVLQDAEQRGVTGKDLLWKVTRQELRNDLDRFLEEDAKLRKRYGVSPHLVEPAFGSVRHRPDSSQTQESVEWSSAKRGAIRFRGYIDRIDLSPDGNIALVLDYKTGKTDDYKNMDKDPVQSGKRLQLPVYGLAARQLLDDGVDVQVAYWFVSSEGNFKTRPSRKAAPLEEMLDPFEDAVDIISDGIGKGFFPANPGKDSENCRFCEFKNLCPTRRERHWRQKRRDDRLAAYAALADGEATT